MAVVCGSLFPPATCRWLPGRSRSAQGQHGVAEDLGVVDGIYTSQAAWPHAPHFPESRTDTRNAERYPNDAYDQADLLQDPAVNTRLEIKRDTVLRC